jgi:hypothetical protein
MTTTLVFLLSRIISRITSRITLPNSKKVTRYTIPEQERSLIITMARMADGILTGDSPIITPHPIGPQRRLLLHGTIHGRTIGTGDLPITRGIAVHRMLAIRIIPTGDILIIIPGIRYITPTVTRTDPVRTAMNAAG